MAELHSPAVLAGDRGALGLPMQVSIVDLDPAGVKAARKDMDRSPGGGRAACSSQISSTLGTGWQAWLHAWCGLRLQNWPVVAREAEAALGYFEVAGDLRRQIELLLLAGLARHQLDRGFDQGPGEAGSSPFTGRALALWQLSGMALHGKWYDPFAGDLPYLLALHGVEGITVPGPDARALGVDQLIEIAWHEYSSFDLVEALPYVARTHARWALDAARPQLAAQRLAQAMEMDRGHFDEHDHRETLKLFVELAALLGFGDVEASIKPWVKEPGSSRYALGEVGLVRRLPVTADELQARWTTARGRSSLLDDLRALRGSIDATLHAPTRFVALHLGDELAMTEDANTWELAFEVGQLLRELGHHRASRRYLEHAVANIEAIRSRIHDGLLRQRFFSDKRPIYLALIDHYVGLDTPNRAQEDYLRALHLANLLKARGLIELFDGVIDTHRLRTPSELDDLRQPTLGGVADRVQAHLDLWKGTLDEASGPSSIVHEDLTKISSSLPKGTALLEYVIGPRRSYVWILTSEGAYMRTLAGREVLSPLLDAFRATLVKPFLSASEFVEHHRLAERLYVELIGPGEDIIVGIDHLLIAPDERLYDLPFEALARPMRQASPRQPHPRYLIETQTVSYVPSTALLARLQERQSQHGGRGLREGLARGATRKALVMGAPDLNWMALELLPHARNLPRGGRFELHEMFPDLPGTRQELATIAGLLQRSPRHEVDVLNGAAASKHVMQTRDLRGYDLIHIATHGVSDAAPWLGASQEPSLVQFLEPALLLSKSNHGSDNGIWTLTDVLGTPISAELVVLSGCTTGRGWRALGDGAYGLAGAFLFSGSQAVIASTWEVSDQDTATLMSAMYTALSKGLSPSAALRKGQLAVIHSRGRQPTPPFYWASFRLVGG